jgi:exodeoxyribonuclease V gamma subunit
VLPAGALSGLEAQRSGAVAQWLDAIDHWRAGRPAHAERWAGLLTDLLAAFFKAEDDTDKRLLGRLEDALSTWVDHCAQAGYTDALSLTVVRDDICWRRSRTARARRASSAVACSSAP